jgi:hypothetical protein
MWAEFIEQNLRSNCMLHSLENKSKMLPASPTFLLSLFSSLSVASITFCPIIIWPDDPFTGAAIAT